MTEESFVKMFGGRQNIPLYDHQDDSKRSNKPGNNLGAVFKHSSSYTVG